jgi:histidinol-phosphate/aromatic aminotransferase/cobyric acid decarboxylase-like protein
LETRLGQIDGLTTFPTGANFVYCELDAGIPGVQLRDVLLRQFGCFIRECGSKIGSNSQFLRIATRPRDQQPRLVNALREAIARIGRDGGNGCGLIDLPLVTSSQEIRR